MSRSYTDVPTLNLDFLKPRRMRFHVPGSAKEGPRNGLGQSIAIGLSGGGHVVGAYEDCAVADPQEHEYTNWIDARMAGSYRFMNVPILTDRMGPFPSINGKPTPILKGVSFSDGSLFSDSSGFSQATVFGTIQSAAALNAGQIVLNVFGAARDLRLSDWFSIYNEVKGWRVHRYWECSAGVAVTKSIDGYSYTGKQYTLGITPPLREAVTAGQRVEFARPLCVMRFPAGENTPWEVEANFMSAPSFQFIEAF